MEKKKDIMKANTEEIRYFEDKLSKEEMLEIAEKNKTRAFGLISGITSKFSNDNQDIKLLKIVKRLDPFWEIVAESSIDYERTSKYKVIVSKEVKKLRIGNKEFETEESRKNDNTVYLKSTDICNKTRKRGMLIDATVLVKDPNHLKHNEKYESYLTESSKKVKKIEDLEKKDIIISSVNIKASFILRSVLQEIIHLVDADKILNEKIEIEKLSLHFRPSYIFEYENTKKKTKGYVSIDSITGKVSFVKEIESKKSKQPLTETAVFDIGVSAFSSLIPGGEAAYRLVKGISKERRLRKNK